MTITQVVTQADVANIKASSISPQFAIDMAIGLMNSELGTANLSEELLFGIQLFLSAHFVAVADPSARTENYAGARFDYDIGKEGMGLASTQFGRAAITLDPTGNLAKTGQKSTSFEVFAWKP